MSSEDVFSSMEELFSSMEDVFSSIEGVCSSMEDVFSSLEDVFSSQGVDLNSLKLGKFVLYITGNNLNTHCGLCWSITSDP